MRSLADVTTIAPRLAGALEAVTDPFVGDGTEWEGVEVRGDLGGEGEVAHLDVAGSRLVGLRLTGRELIGLRLIDVVLEDCELSGVRIADGHFTRVELRRCRLAGLVAAGLKARDVLLEDCTASGAAFRMSTWERCEFHDVDLSEADFYAARLPGARLLRCDLRGADFTKAELPGAALHHSTLDGIRGAESLRGVKIGSAQVLSLALPLFAALGIAVDDDAQG
jgi:uncharacterized protein YjbI with pentapeptide repeats